MKAVTSEFSEIHLRLILTVKWAKAESQCSWVIGILITVLCLLVLWYVVMWVPTHLWQLMRFEMRKKPYEIKKKVRPVSLLPQTVVIWKLWLFHTCLYVCIHAWQLNLFTMLFGLSFHWNTLIYVIAVPQVAEGFPESTGIKESKEGSVASKQLTTTLPKIHSRNFRE